MFAMQLLKTFCNRAKRNYTESRCDVFELYETAPFLSYLFYVNSVLQRWDKDEIIHQDVVAKAMIREIIAFRLEHEIELIPEDFEISENQKARTKSHFQSFVAYIQTQKGVLTYFKDQPESQLLQNLYTIYNPNCAPIDGLPL
jgi:hypothetical protein